MGHTNSTANLSLPQFIGTDKPTWLGDVNGAFGAIDTAVGTINADILAVDAKADNAVADASSAVTVANNASTTAGNASTTATTANNIANNALTVANNADGHTNQLEMKVGLLADLTTTDKTSIVNAINEVNGAIGTPSASQVSYDNTGSGLTATNVQDAIDEVAQGGGGSSIHKISVTADGVKTYGQLLNELYALVDFSEITNFACLTDGASFGHSLTLISKEATELWFSESVCTASGVSVLTMVVGSSSVYHANNAGTYSNKTSVVPTNGDVFEIMYIA